jgi:ribosomal protein L11 methylase PrmA
LFFIEVIFSEIELAMTPGNIYAFVLAAVTSDTYYHVRSDVTVLLSGVLASFDVMA